MRNLKRALSLALASVMVLGLMVVGSGASYKDVSSENNQEAIEVLQAVGIMVGDDNGNFNPEANVTRNEMAVIMSNLMDYRVASYAGTSPFTDVPAWAEPYVAACWTNGITSGYTATTYGGSDTVTTAQAALMLMKALGYFQFQSDFEDDWQLATVKQANKIDLFDDVASGVREPMTRNDVAQLVLNTLESGIVEADDNTIKVETDGTKVEAGKVNYNYVTSSKDYAYAINWDEATSSTSSTKGAIVELGEKLYNGDLTKENGYDDFGRPANVWDYQAKEIGTFADSADYTFTAKVTSKALYNKVGKTATDNYNWSVSFNGTTIKYDGDDLNAYKSDDDKDFVLKAGVSASALTANGVLTEVFVDGTYKTVDIAIIEFYAAEVYKVDESEGTIKLSDLDKGPAKTTDEFDSTDFEEDDIVIYSYANGDIQTVVPATRMEGEVTRVRAITNDTDGDNFVVDGNTYKYNKTALANRLTTDNVDNDVVAYLDSYGYVAYIDESAVTYDYAYVLSMGTDSDQYGAGSSNKGTTVYARLVLTDGTIIKVETDVKTSDANGVDVNNDSTVDIKDAIALYENHLVSYTADKNDVYSLTARSNKIAASANGNLKVENGVASMLLANTRYTANANTIFVVADPDSDSYDDYDFTIYTGVKNVPDIDGNSNTQIAVATETGSKVAKVVYIEDADVSGSGEVIFARADGSAKRVKDTSIGNWYEINAVVDGELVTLKVKENSTAATALVKNVTGKQIVALKSYTENSDGLVTSIRAYATIDANGDGYILGVGTEKAEKDTVMLKGVTTKDHNNQAIADARYAWTDDVVVVRYDYKGDFSVSRISSIKDDDDDAYVAVLDGDVITGICVLENDSNANNNQLSDDIEVTNLDLDNGVISYYVESGKKALTNDDILTILKDAGCTNISMTGSNWNFTTKSGLPKSNISITQRQVYEVTYVVKVDGAKNTDWKVTGTKDTIANGDTLTLKIEHDLWSAYPGNRYVSLSGAATSTEVTVSNTGNAATVQLTVADLAADGEVIVNINNSARP